MKRKKTKHLTTDELWAEITKQYHVSVAKMDKKLMDEFDDWMNKNAMECINTQNCKNYQKHCTQCKHNELLTRGSDWSPTDWYSPIVSGSCELTELMTKQEEKRQQIKKQV